MNNPVLENIKTRRSVRSFRDRQITAAETDAILEAGAWAASGMNLQGWKLVAVQSPEALKALNEAMRQTCLNLELDGAPEYYAQLKEKAQPADAWMLFQSPGYILVTYDHEQGNAMADSALALGNMMLAAHSLGIGTVWHNFIARLSHLPEVQAYLKTIGVPEGHHIYGTLAIGYPDSPLPAPEDKPRVGNTVIKV